MGELIKVTMPKWGLSMKEGTVSDWIVEEGDEIEKGQEIVEIETDKIANVLESPGSGILQKIVAHSGEVLPVAALIGVITDGAVSDDEISAFIEQENAAAAAAAVDEAPDPLTISKVFEWEGLNIRYIDSEDGEDPLICLHGFGGDKNNWQFNLAALAPNRRVLAPDFPSHGDSTVSAEHSSPLAYAQDGLCDDQSVGVGASGSGGSFDGRASGLAGGPGESGEGRSIDLVGASGDWYRDQCGICRWLCQGQ